MLKILNEELKKREPINLDLYKAAGVKEIIKNISSNSEYHYNILEAYEYNKRLIVKIIDDNFYSLCENEDYSKPIFTKKVYNFLILNPKTRLVQDWISNESQNTKYIFDGYIAYKYLMIAHIFDFASDYSKCLCESVKYLDKNSKSIIITLTDICKFEIDILNDKLFIDRLNVDFIEKLIIEYTKVLKIDKGAVS